jgi:hypothetical protein
MRSSDNRSAASIWSSRVERDPGGSGAARNHAISDARVAPMVDREIELTDDASSSSVKVTYV